MISGTDLERGAPTVVLEFRVLGPLEVRLDGAPLVALHNAPRLRALLGYLLLYRDRSIDRSRLAGDFWPDVPERHARRRLNSALYRLRTEHPPGLTTTLDARAHTLRWRLPAGARLDLDAFERDATPRRDHESATTWLARAERAATLYRGPLLAGTDMPWLAPERARLERTLIHLLEQLVATHEQRGDPARARAHAMRLRRLEA